jgi:microcystin-dependent protein
MATKPENPSPIFNLPVFIPENWTDITTSTSSTTPSVISTKIVGEIIAYQGTTLPSSNWLWCDGAGYDALVYTDLFAVIGYSYGISTDPDPASSSTSGGADLIFSPDLNTGNTIPYEVNTNQVKQFWTIVIPSNTATGTPNNYTLTTPVSVVFTGSFSPFGIAQLKINFLVVSATFEVFKDGILFTTGTANLASGGVNPLNYEIYNTTSSATFNGSSPIGNYSMTFTPTNQPTSATYTIKLVLTYSSNGNVVGGSSGWGSTQYIECNSTTTTQTSSVSAGSFLYNSATPTGYEVASATWNGATYFDVPDLSGKTPVGSDTTANIGTTYAGSSVVSGGNRIMSANQLATHSHSIDVSPTAPMLVSFSQNNAIQGIAAGSGDIVKTALYGQSTYTATASNAGGTTELLPPFNVSNFIIRAN